MRMNLELTVVVCVGLVFLWHARMIEIVRVGTVINLFLVLSIVGVLHNRTINLRRPWNKYQC